MKRIFFHVWFVSILLLMIGLLCEIAFTYMFLSDDEVEFWNQMTSPVLMITADYVVDEAEEEAREERLTYVSETSGLEAKYLMYSDLPQHIHEQYQDGNTIIWDVTPVGELVYISSEKGSGILMMGPFYEYPYPDPFPRLILVIILGATLGISFWFILRPLDKSQMAIVHATQQISRGEFTIRLAPEETPAAPKLAKAFNEMSERIEALVGHQQRMLRVASHELRTPLAKLRFGVHLLETQSNSDRIKELELDLDELESLVESILLQAQLERTGLQITNEISVSDTVYEVVEEQQMLHPQIQIKLIHATKHIPNIIGSKILFRRALVNLISNATRYAKTIVQVSLNVQSKRVIITVQDDGPGIPLSKQQDAIRPFVKLDETSKHGLGLSIVEGVLQAHGGVFNLKTAALGGLEAEMIFPFSGEKSKE